MTDWQNTTFITVDKLVHESISRNDKNCLVKFRIELVKMLLGKVPTLCGDDVKLKVSVFDELEKKIEFLL